MVFPDVLADCRARVQFIETLPVKCEVLPRRMVHRARSREPSEVCCVDYGDGVSCRNMMDDIIS